MCCHKYVFARRTPMSAVESSLILAIWSCESLHGEALVRLNAMYDVRTDDRTIVIDSSTPVGEDLNKLFVGLLQREFGEGAFAVVRMNEEQCVAASEVRSSSQQRS
jgi:hypothetical protein